MSGPKARRTEFAVELLGHLLALLLGDFPLVDLVDLVADEDHGHVLRVLDADDLGPEAVYALERGTCRG
jgi:hypothetical protein